MASNVTATYPPTFSESTISTAHSPTLSDSEAKLLDRFRRLARDGGRLQVEVSGGRVFFWSVNKEGVSNLG